MTSDRPADYLASLLRELCALPRETEWVEFKMNDAEPQAVGEHISALANSAALMGKAFAYLVWGVRDEDHALVGTTFDPLAARVGNEELESWLLRLLEPKIDFRFFTVGVDGAPVALLEVARAAGHPVRFSGQEFIRVGTYKKKLKDFPEKERALWRIFDQVVSQVELFQLPAPLFEVPDGFTRTLLFAHKALSAMDKNDRVRACYLHACLKYVTRGFLTNTSLRERFGIDDHNRSTVSRLIHEAVKSGAVIPYDPSAAPKQRKYVPWWAAGQGGDVRP